MSPEKKFLIDANLPYYFSIWHTDHCLHVSDIDERMADEDIWEFAKKNDYIIVSKDSDFSDRLILTHAPPKVIHVKVGNMRLRHFYQLMLKSWPIAETMIEEYKIVNIYQDTIEGIK